MIDTLSYLEMCEFKEVSVGVKITGKCMCKPINNRS